MARLDSTPVWLSLALCFVVALPACGGAEPSGSATPKSVPTATVVSAKPVEPPAPKPPSARDKLQGKWEITSYQADRSIPEEAAALMGTLFKGLRLELSGTNATARIEGSSVQEQARFDTGSESGDEFTIYAPGFMFDGARCRFTGEGQVEVRDTGERWPGVSALRRVP